jgi:hypothetical protein
MWVVGHKYDAAASQVLISRAYAGPGVGRHNIEFTGGTAKTFNFFYDAVGSTTSSSGATTEILTQVTTAMIDRAGITLSQRINSAVFGAVTGATGPIGTDYNNAAYERLFCYGGAGNAFNTVENNYFTGRMYGVIKVLSPAVVSSINRDATEKYMAGKCGIPTTYDTWNPSDKNAGSTLSGGNLICTDNFASGVWGTGRSKVSKNSGKWYVEVTITTISTGSVPGWSGAIGFATAAASIANNDWLGRDAAGWAFTLKTTTSPSKINNSVSTPLSTITNASAGDKGNLAIDFDAGKIWIGKNGVWDTGDPAAGTLPSFTFTPNTAMFLAYSNQCLSALTLNAGATAFTTAAPAGFNSGWYN